MHDIDQWPNGLSDVDVENPACTELNKLIVIKEDSEFSLQRWRRFYTKSILVCDR